MPIFKAKNENFFKVWTPEMAYVLGFFTADGNMIKNKRGAHFISIEITDRDILEEMKRVIGSNHNIGLRERSFPQKTAYRLQIGSKEMFNNLLELGLTPNKSKSIQLPKVPDRHFPHFVRGYFDGDGSISYGLYKRKDRKSKKFVLLSSFTSGNKIFLHSLLKALKKLANIEGGSIYEKTRGFQMNLSVQDSKKLFRFMYSNISEGLLLERKYNKFERGLKLLKSHIS